MPDLGKYAATVLGAYGASVALIVLLVAVVLWRGARVKRALEAQEARMGRNG
ncbi:heme exporter protein CcmD [Frigidibacter sp. MR17.14]|uniref:heme exporter protein CcmD n=1 Tax=Frigidibacter sp. MR17.14 TaxID=3126509 RepID=UPI003FA5CC5B